MGWNVFLLSYFNGTDGVLNRLLGALLLIFVLFRGVLQLSAEVLSGVPMQAVMCPPGNMCVSLSLVQVVFWCCWLCLCEASVCELPMAIK